MLLPYLIYTILIILAGAIGLCFRDSKGITPKYLPASIISIGSFFLLVYLLWTFPVAESDQAVRIMNWSMPFGNMVAGIDPLSAFFLIPLLILALACSLYGPAYFKTHPAGRAHWFFFGLLVAGMVMVLLARNAVLFLIAWEVMSLASFFLVITDKEKVESIRAGWIYFVTAHIGTAFLLALFFLCASLSGSFDF